MKSTCHALLFVSNFLWPVSSFKDDLWKQVHIMNQTVTALWQSQKQNPSAPLNEFPTCVSWDGLKVPLQIEECVSLCVCGVVCEVFIWLHYLREVEAILTMKAKQNNNLFSLSMTDIKTSPIRVMDLARLGSAGLRAPGCTLSSNHLILMLLHCLVNQPSIYINPYAHGHTTQALNRISRYCAAHFKHIGLLKHTHSVTPPPPPCWWFPAFCHSNGITSSQFKACLSSLTVITLPYIDIQIRKCSANTVVMFMLCTAY